REGKPEANSVAIIREALDKGVNFIDTAEAYRTEGIVGEAIKGIDRDLVVLSTKKSTSRENQLTAQEVQTSLETSLKQLGVDYIDIYHLHGVRLEQYDYLLQEIVPVLQNMRQQGKIGYLGITEAFSADTDHAMLQHALRDDVWDVMMVGFNILNQTAREQIFTRTIPRDIGILIMFAVRLAFSQPDRLRETIAELIERGELDPSLIDAQNPLSFVLDDAESLADAAYRFCLYEPGTHVILSGTGNIDHLHANLESFERPPLSPEVSERLKQIFAGVDSVSGQ
ncbi:MAG: aldo/keto reductase, partial [Anaerolineae bacterium]|nr:aldo/keto reductase [Anaerolineae bacterium]